MVGCNAMLDMLRSQLADAFAIRTAGSGCVIETPFQYPDRRVLTVYAAPLATGDVELSDDGYAHSYARVSGVSDDVLKRAIQSVADRYAVEASHGEVVATVSEDHLFRGLVSLIEASQGIADTVSRKRLGESSNRLDRQIQRLLVLKDRVYERRAKIPVGAHPVDVDFSVLPTDKYQQLNMFSMSHKLNVRGAESMAYRIGRIKQGEPAPGYTNRVLVVSDQSALFQNADRWRTIRKTLQDTGAKIVPISDVDTVSQWLTA